MKHLFILSILLLGAMNISAQTTAKTVKADKAAKINWLTLEEAQALNKTNPKKIMVDLYTEWCGPCKMMMKQTFTDPALISYINENFYAVKFNAESQAPVTFKGKLYSNPTFNPAKTPRQRNAVHEYTRTTGIRGYPTLIIYNSEVEIIDRIVGFQKAPQVMRKLKKLKKTTTP